MKLVTVRVEIFSTQIKKMFEKNWILKFVCNHQSPLIVVFSIPVSELPLRLLWQPRAEQEQHQNVFYLLPSPSVHV